MRLLQTTVGLALTDFLEFQAVVRAEWHAPAAVNAHKRLLDMIQENSIDRTGVRALAASDA
jgi:hypothetical protein